MGMAAHNDSDQDVLKLIVDSRGQDDLFLSKIDTRVKFENGVYPEIIKTTLMKNAANLKGNDKRRFQLESAISKNYFEVSKASTFCLICFKKFNVDNGSREHPYFQQMICLKCHVSVEY